MQMREIGAGTVLYERGQELAEMHLIVKGEVKASYVGGELVLRAGDVTGLCEISRGATYMTYQVTGDVTVISYSSNQEHLEELFVKKPETVKYFLSSLFRQFGAAMGRYKALKSECDVLYRYLDGSYKDYSVLCISGKLPQESLSEYDEVELFEPKETVPDWLEGYYAALEQMASALDSSKTSNQFANGFLIKASRDILMLIQVCGEMQAYKEKICQYLMNESGLDLFHMYASLYVKMAERSGLEDAGVLKLRVKVNEILTLLKNQKMDQLPFYKKRLEEFERIIKQLDKNGEEEEKTSESEQDTKALLEELSGSLDVILKYAECAEDVAAEFKEHILAYKRLANKNGTEDEVRTLRHQITRLFYQIYIAAFQVSMGDKNVPKILRMFFDFGYVDEELAGIKNALFLYRLTDKLPSDPKRGVYSCYEWLKAIYEGKKEPCRNEFDADYPEYLREQKRIGKITAQREQQLLRDNKAKVMYELENVFPTVNKITYGRISTFCPVFSEHNILKPLDTILVTADCVLEDIDAVRKADFGAFYRETMYADAENGIVREFIDVEVLPDIILMPNAGTRGIMWQEIEGKKRTTPARMMTSIFQMEDLSLIMVRLAGEFRWEMCKRMQGSRWNDISEPSLTSEYFDYIQFYRKNNELSPDAKERIKGDMAKAKNSFKEMFIRDYILWVRFESSGSPRLNKVARNILFSYCPFPREVRTRLAANPLYREVMERYGVRMSQKLHRIDILCQKLKNMGKEVPEEIINQKKFLEL